MSTSRPPMPNVEADDQFIRSLRPRTLDECIGQAKVLEGLRISVQAAQERGEPLDHVLLHGPPGLGKTTLANVVAHEMKANIVTTSGPALERGGDLMGVLTNLQGKDVLFIDEIHRLSRAVEEFLYPFTLVGATTRAGLLSSPLRERFGIFHHLDFFSVEDLVLVVKRSAKILGIEISEDGAATIARRSRGTPRIANRLLRRVRDYAQVRAGGAITADVAAEALAFEGVDDRGLDGLDRGLLRTIATVYSGGPVGIEALAATLNEEAQTLEEVVEPFLLKIAFLTRTPAGRRITPAGVDHLGLTLPERANGRGQGDLF